jgi:FMN phosphatase YigB (HAD superfamily)
MSDQTVSPASDHTRPIINSFDIFDTLIARSCFEPVKIHEQVEKKTGVEAFARHRRAAEIAVSNREYTLDDIYVEMGRMQGWSAALLDRLKQAEIDAELDNVIPIADNIALVRDGDVLVSDMYLSEPLIRRLLHKAGLRKNVGIYVSSHGKASGKVWSKILKNFRIAAHTGDSKRNDVESPKAHGISAKHTAAASPIEAEAWLIKIGLRDVALLCREVRLTSASSDNLTRELLNLQTSLNFPMLLLASVPLARLVQQRGIKRVLFSSRDSELWMKAFRKFAAKIGLTCEIEYFYTSRLARRSPSPDYLAYARDRLSGQSLLLDLCGTGWSIAHLIKTIGRDKFPVFMLRHMPMMDAYERTAPMPDTCEFYSIVGRKVRANDYLEWINAAPYGSVIDVRRIDDTIVPVLDVDRRHPAAIAFVHRQTAIFETLVDAIDKHKVEDLMMVDDKIAAAIAAKLMHHICNQHLLRDLFMTAALEEGADVFRRLGLPEIYVKQWLGAHTGSHVIGSSLHGPT